MELIIDCVWCSNRKDFVKFTKTCEGYTSTIDYFAISNKLLKSDVDGQEPTSSVIGLSIIKQLTSILTKEVDSVKEDKKIIYLIKNLKSDTIKALKQTISSIHKDTYGFNLIIINSESFPKKDVLLLFDSIKVIDN